MKITHCKTSHIENPLGFSLPKPLLGWCVEDASGQTQTEARIVLSENPDLSQPILDTGFSAELSSLGFAAEFAQAPRTRYYWTVTVRSDAGEEATSATNWFETAKLEEEWAAKWITCDSEEKRHPIFEKELPLVKPVAKARLYICGLGLYEASLNGEKIGEEFLTPGSNNYNAWTQYQTYDITAPLQKGGTMRVTLGNGWYKGRFGFDYAPEPKGFYGTEWKLLAEVRVTYTDGTEAVFGTDDTWLVHRSGITASGIYDGECMDDTLPDITAVPATLCEAPTGALTARYSVPVTLYKSIPAILLTTPTGELVLDVGQNIAGIFSLNVNLPRGAAVRLQFGEILQDGCFYRDNLRSAKAEYTYISDGKAHVLQPKFTYYGYRYVKVEGIPDLNPADFTALVLTSALERTADLQVEHPLVQKLIESCEWGCIDNFVDVPTDCPQRDERMGWTADTQVFASTACIIRDATAFYRKYLHDMATEQVARDGAVPEVVPAFMLGAAASVWGDAATIIPWEVYEASGDVSILEEHFDSMCAWVDYITRMDGDDCDWRRAKHLGDWLALDLPGAADDATSGATALDFIGDVYYMYSAELTAKAATVLGRSAAAEKYAALAKALRARIQAEFYSPTGRCCSSTQTALLLTLRHSLADEARTCRDLQKVFTRSHNKLQTGFVGTPILCDTLAEHGMSDFAAELLLNEEFPGWLYEIKLGATTVWERWNSLDKDGHVSSTGMNSLNHYAYGTVLGWMYRHLAGFQRTAPGSRTMHLAPTPIWDLHSLTARAHTPAGTYELSWRIVDENHLTVSFTVPFNATATVVLPCAAPETFADAANPLFADVRDGVCCVGTGSYTVSYRTGTPLHTRLSIQNTVQELLNNRCARAVLLQYAPGCEMLPVSLSGLPLCDALAALGSHPAGVALRAMLPALDAALAAL